MSYVRFSTPIELPDGVDDITYYMSPERYCLPTSDFYIYDDVSGHVTVHLAGNRHVPIEPFIGEKVINSTATGHNNRISPAYLQWLESHRHKIEHPDAGKTFAFEEMSEAVAAVERWISEGFLAPDWLINELKAEIEGA